MRDTALLDDLFSAICAGSCDADMFECMRRHGVDEHEHLSLLADANMNHEIITDLRSQLAVLQHRLDTLQADHTSLQAEHAALQTEHTSLQAEHAALQAERARERDDSAAMRAALQNLSCVPYGPMRRGFEICRILKCK